MRYSWFDKIRLQILQSMIGTKLARYEITPHLTSPPHLLFHYEAALATVIKKDRRALTVPTPVRGIQSRNNFNRTMKGAFVWTRRSPNSSLRPTFVSVA